MGGGFALGGFALEDFAWGGRFVLGTIFCLRDAFGAEVGVDMGSSSSLWDHRRRYGIIVVDMGSSSSIWDHRRRYGIIVVDMGSSSSTASLPFGPAKVSFIFAFTGSVEAFGGPVFARFERGPLSFMSKNGGDNLTKNRAGKGEGAGDGSDYILQLRISVLEQVTMHSYHIDGEGSLAGWSLFSLNFVCKRQ